MAERISDMATGAQPSVKTLMCVIPAMAGGGVERVLLDLLRHLPRDHFRLHLVVFDQTGPLQSNVPEDVQVTCFPKWHPIAIPWILLRLWWLIKIEKPDIILSFMWLANVLSGMAAICNGRGNSVIASEHNAMSFELAASRFSRLKRAILSLYLRLGCPCMVVPSRGVGEDLIRHFHLQPSAVQVIPNPVDAAAIQTHSKLQPDIALPDRFFLSVGRLVLQKNHALLLDALACLDPGDRLPLVILGDGPERDRLQSQARQLGIAELVMFPGFLANPYAVMARAECLVLTSRFEGFGLVILEAMACGTPVIALDCPYGPADWIINDLNGILETEYEAAKLAGHLVRLSHTPELRGNLIQKGYDTLRKVSLPDIIHAYSCLILDRASLR